MLNRIAAAAALIGLALPAAAQDADAGQRVFNQCRACHTVEQGGRNGVGPNLYGVFGRRAASVEGFRYSAAMRAKGEEGLVWQEATLRPYLEAPRTVVPGGSMTFAGLRNEQQMSDLIAYLRRATGAQ
ncbi:c-type cytochrome [Plastoroseomonas hellenica]|uniref:c-type cytochrome n=1 Tax=Plastoroseomonas hellenica TaxID=2687306 RepID=UPI001BA91466|nr:cytochrome c family protein [Plastoroseomonas hellenica]MBR0644043.1 cytochrome c family protein [Plastoroseomonas hellenica]